MLRLAGPIFVTGALFLASACGSDSGSGSKDGSSVFADSYSPGDSAWIPGDDGSGPGPECMVTEDCPPEMPQCDFFSHKCVECKKNEHCTGSDQPICNPAAMTCVECVMDSDCSTEFEHCLEGKCSDKACFPGHATCVGNSVHICSPDGQDPNFEVFECGEKVCNLGQCLECKPNQKSCKGNLVVECDATGASFEVLETCPAGLQCLAAQCLFCYPGEGKCEGNMSYICKNDGAGWLPNEDCSAKGLTCYMGVCLSPCAGDIKQNTNAGCEFYAVDLDNAKEGDYDAQNAQYAVIASNTSKTDNVTVTVTLPDDTTKDATLGPMSLHKFELPSKWGLDNTMKGMNAFRINATRPIIVYQFNPLSNKIQVFSNDASVLLPAPSLGTEYFVMSYGQLGSSYKGYFTVIGTSTIPTEVTFTPTSKTMAGGGMPALNKGQAHTVTLEQGEVLNVETNQANGDLTGTYIKAAAPIAVFGGHEATNMVGLCCADHLEQQMTPVNTWGSHFLISKAWERLNEKDHIRILAAKDGTKVTLNPAVAIVPTLNAGQHFTFQTNVNLEVTANNPIMVAQYLASSYEILGGANVDSCFSDSDCPTQYGYVCDWFSGFCAGKACSTDANCPSGHTCESYGFDSACEPIGDPAMIVAVSEDQFLDSYVFLVPDAYLQDYVNVIAPLNAQQVVLDNMQINPNDFNPIGASGYGVYRKALGDGVHTVWSDQKIGIVVYGYDNDVSYGYPGGMGLSDLD